MKNLDFYGGMVDAQTAVSKTMRDSKFFNERPVLLDADITKTKEIFSNGPKESSVNNSSSGGPTASAPGETQNILNNYRSVTYNITLAALSPEDLKDPAGYRARPLKYVVAKSGGKGKNAISSQVTAFKTNIIETETVREGGKILGTKENITGTKLDYGGTEAVKEFNKESPGQFELFIDGLEIETLLAPNEQTGPAIATKLKFEIFEPMSANGYIEALHVSALAAGWSGYLNACYVVKLEFVGYPDDSLDPIADSKKIDATRYYPIKLTGSEMDVTETGTKYRCSAIPYNEHGYANPNVIFTDISFSGNTVREVVESLFEGINKSTEDRASKEKVRDVARIYNKYEVYFPSFPKSGQSLTLDNSSENKMSKAKINEQLRSNAVYKFPPIEQSSANSTPGSDGRNTNDPRRTDSGSSNKRYDPTKNQIQFSKGSNIHEILEAVIRDSLYFEEILKDVEEAKKGDGMIDYFQIMINTIPGEMDVTFNEQRFIYQYIICPYKVHYSKLPGQQFTNFDAKTMKNYVKRVYNYLYTGQNIDVLSFKLNFNNLFFQAANPKMGNNDKKDTSSGAGASNDRQVEVPANAGKDASRDQNDRAPLHASDSAGSNSDRGQPVQQNPYYQIAYAAHKAILESVNMLTGEIEILGDPFYISTGGMGNYLPKLKDQSITTTGEANFNNGPVVVRINFRNPIDIDEQTGLVKFSKTNVAFSGVYQVLSCSSALREGIFKQRLKIMRYNGQIADGSDLKPTPAFLFSQEDKPGEQQTVDKAGPDVVKAGVKPNELELTAMIKRGLPTTGLPGQTSNLLADISSAQAQFKKVSGSLGPGMNLLNQASNLTGLNVGDALTGVNPLLSGIPMSVSALSSMASKIPASASLVNQAGNIAGTLIPGDPSALLNSDISEKMSADIGSFKQGLTNKGIPLTPGISNLLDSSKGMMSSSLASLKEMGDSSGGMLGGIGDKIKNLSSYSSNGNNLSPAARAAVIADATKKGIPVDQALRNASMFGANLPGFESSPAAIAAKLGIDPSQISGLSGTLDSKIVKQVEQLAEEVPENVDLEKVKKQGIIMSNLAGDTLKNLPGIPPNLRSLGAELPARSVSSALTAEQRAAVIADANKKGIPVDQALRNAAVFGINLKGLTPEAQAIALSDLPQSASGNLSALSSLGITSADIASGKFAAIQKQLGGLVPEGLPGSDTFAGLQDQAAKGLGSLQGIGKSASSLFSGGGSVESSLSGIQTAMGNPGSGVTQLENLGKSVTSKFGSLTGSVGTPLDKLMNNSVNKLNDPSAPPYTGNDPIVRRRLGLPPIEEA